LKGSEGDALHAVLCAAGFNIRWLLRAIARLGLRGLLLALNVLVLYGALAVAVAAAATVPGRVSNLCSHSRDGARAHRRTWPLVLA
jgi:IS5 family transposase